ncbi:beta-N-acetylhexosaminidase [Paenibacillus thermotolerans]|uniref:beta-N-acetylhexosaminidase n=1 Tax=Paenibacillus thermotolerans TaxID=3027807 RepID=UPI002368B116|nr:MULTISPECIES: beta-N-acetylhexosaminidase [unclassified Paenibacillus]
MDWKLAVERMSLKEKIGQLVLCGFPGTNVPEELAGLIREYRISGVILFARNVDTVEQVAVLTGELQRVAAEAGVLPLWISIDQEGGMVARLTEGVALMPGNMALGAAGSAELARQAAAVCGEELRALGINMNYAPVLDVNNNAANPVIGVRSYGESPLLVAELGAASIVGYQSSGVAATAKHFPGHGDTSVDSHLDLPVVPHGRERMDRVELVPFRRAIAVGVDLIMTAHIHFPALEPDRVPATLSKRVLTELLREELIFDGVITTDCMEMNAISEHYGTVEASIMALEAGADLVLISHRIDRQRAALEAIEAAVVGGRIPMERIDESVRRVVRLKAKRGLLGGGAGAVSPEALASVGSAGHMEVARAASEASITLVRNEGGVVPLKRVRTLAVTVAATAQTIADDELSAKSGLGAALASYGLDCADVVLSAEEVGQRSAEIVEAGAAGDVAQIVVGVYNASFHPAQIQLVRELQALGKPLAVVALRSPYDLLALGDVPAYVAAYENRPLSVQSSAKALLGLIPFRGKLPVSLGERYPAGWGLSLG